MLITISSHALRRFVLPDSGSVALCIVHSRKFQKTKKSEGRCLTTFYIHFVESATPPPAYYKHLHKVSYSLFWLYSIVEGYKNSTGFHTIALISAD